MGRLEEELARERAVREASGLARALEPRDAAGARADFSSNDYLGLARDPRVCEAAAAAALTHGAGARAARLLGGGSPLERAAERALAEWLDAEEALLFPSGYQANLGWIPCVVGPGDVLFSDALVHASLIDAARLSRARVEVYRHADPEHLASLLAQARGARRRLVLTEGVFSMDGDRAPLVELATVCREHDARLAVDEAHAVGVLGPEGRGAWAEALARGAPPEALLARVVTGGKALGVAGAFVAGPRALHAHLVDRARSFVFTTGVPPAVAGALVAAIARARAADGERAALLSLARGLARDLDLPEPGAAIVPVPVGDDARSVEVADALQRAGLDVRAVRPPTVPRGTARLRLVVHAHDRPGELERLVGALRAHGLPRAPLGRSPRPERAAPVARLVVVVGTDTGVGKTVVSALVARALARSGPVAYWKPVQTGEECDTSAVRRMTEDLDLVLHEPCYRFALPASPHEAAAAEGARVDPGRIDADLARHRGAGGTLVIELAGGLLVPWNESTLQADWIERWGARVVLVARSGLGTLNHTLLTVEALRRRRLAPGSLWLVGTRHPSNRATLAERVGVPIVELPPLACLDPESLARVLESHAIPRP